MLELFKNLNLGLAFLLELCMLAAFAFWGFSTGQTTLAKVIQGLGVPLVVAVLWGVFLAPRASLPLPRLLNLALKVLIFGIAALALALAGRPTLAWILAIVFVVNQVLLAVWK